MFSIKGNLSTVGFARGKLWLMMDYFDTRTESDQKDSLSESAIAASDDDDGLVLKPISIAAKTVKAAKRFSGPKESLAV